MSTHYAKLIGHDYNNSTQELADFISSWAEGADDFVWSVDHVTETHTHRINKAGGGDPDNNSFIMGRQSLTIVVKKG